MAEQRVWVFFYGSYMNPAVLKDIGVVAEQWQVARLPGFDIHIEPLANLVRSDRATAYGILATATHTDLSRLYAHAHDVLGEIYLPEAVLVQTLDLRWQPALCYICPGMKRRAADPAYIERIAGPAGAHRFPEWYVQRIESFRKPGSSAELKI